MKKEGKKVLMVSKPLLPPWDDSGKNLVKDVVRFGESWQYHVLGLKQGELAREIVESNPGVKQERVYKGSGSYSPSLGQNLRVLLRLFRPDDLDIYHFFFAPNPMTSLAARLVRRLKPGKRFVQTICSIPATFEGIERLMFADRVIALSESTARKLINAGVPNVVRIPPAIDTTPRVTDEARLQIRRDLGLPLDKPLILYAGDYQFSSAAATCANALPRIMEKTQAHFVFACRIKQELSRTEESRIRQQVAAQGLSDRVSFFNELPGIIDLVGSADLQVLPAATLFAKMDIPLVLLESLRERVPLVVANQAPLSELLEKPVGIGVSPEDPADLARGVVELLSAPEELKRMGEAGQKFVQEKFSARAVAAKYETLYDELLEKKGAGKR